MASKFTGFLDNFGDGVTNPKGNLGDFKHASRLYSDDTHRLAPKTKYLFYVVFEVGSTAKLFMPSLEQKHLRETFMLAKSIDLPQYSANIETKNQYNKKKLIQTSIEYSPVTIKLHDDNQGITTFLLEAYFKYYFRDSKAGDLGGYKWTPDYDYAPESHKLRYGLDTGMQQPFFTSIKLYQFAKQQFTEYTLVNPLVERWGHDSLDQSDGAGIAENTLVLNYETVLYRRGKVGADDPAAFAGAHYDKTPSPLPPPGGGVSNIFGAGGILDGGSSVLGDFSRGEVGLGTAINAVNTAENLKDVSKDSLKAEAKGIATGAAINIGVNAAIGIGGALSAPADITEAAEPDGSAPSIDSEDKTIYAGRDTPGANPRAGQNLASAGRSTPGANPRDNNSNLWARAR